MSGSVRAVTSPGSRLPSVRDCLAAGRTPRRATAFHAARSGAGGSVESSSVIYSPSPVIAALHCASSLRRPAGALIASASRARGSSTTDREAQARRSCQARGTQRQRLTMEGDPDQTARPWHRNWQRVTSLERPRRSAAPTSRSASAYHARLAFLHPAIPVEQKRLGPRRAASDPATRHRLRTAPSSVVGTCRAHVGATPLGSGRSLAARARRRNDPRPRSPTGCRLPP
jgi:hypothetical protein